MADAIGSAAGGDGNFEVVARAARVEKDLNSRDARLARLADDPLRLRKALTEAQGREREHGGPALSPTASGAVAMMMGSEKTARPDHSTMDRSYADATAAEQVADGVEYYNPAEDETFKSSQAPKREFAQLTILVLSVTGLLALSALLLFAA